MRGRVRTGLYVGLALLAGCATAPPAPPPEPVAATPKKGPKPPDRVAGLLKGGPEAVEAALGPPVLRRPEGAGEVWLYAHANGCSIDVVLLPIGGTPRVAHAATRTPASMTESDCLLAIADGAP